MTVLWNEAINGDLSNLRPAPTPLGSLSLGDNFVTAALPEVPESDDQDVFSFQVPEGFVVSGIRVTQLDITGSIGFNVFLENSSGLIAGLNSESAGVGVGSNLFTINNFFRSGFAAPLTAGTYKLFTTGFGVFGASAYEFNLVLSSPNTPPTNLSLSNTAIAENVLADTTVGDFSTTDAQGGNFTYALVSGTGSTDNALFTISDNQLKINTSPDFETKSSYSIRVKTTDADGLSFEKVLTITVNDVNEAPVFSSGTTATFDENKIGTVYTASATDPDNDVLSYSLTGTDATLFAIDSSTGAVTFKTAPNFEDPADSDKNNVYDITVTASPAVGSSASRDVAINVTNVNEAPTATGETVSTSKNTGNPVTNVTLNLVDNLTDPDTNGLVGATLAVTSTTNGTIANIDQDAQLITFTPTAGFSGTASFNYTVTDAGGLTSNEATVIVEIGDVLTTGNKDQDLQGNSGNDYISSGNGKDRIRGFGGNDTLLGNNGADTIEGGSGDDLIDGGNGPDLLTGGSGRDTFVLKANAGGDTITDFSLTEDWFKLGSGLTFGTGNSTTDIKQSLSGSNLLISSPNNTVLATLQNVNSLLTSSNFTV